jgi:hypothetical protein
MSDSRAPPSNARIGRHPNENALFVALANEGNSAMNRTDLADLNAFIVIADHLSFRAASTQPGTPQRCAPSLT